MWFWIIAGLIALLLIYKMIRVIPQGKLWVVERFGKYHRTLTPGVHFLWPIMDHVVRKVTTKEQFADFPPQSVITNDNVTIEIDAVVFYKIENDVEDNALSWEYIRQLLNRLANRNEKAGEEEDIFDKSSSMIKKKQDTRKKQVKKLSNAAKSVYGVENPRIAIETLTATTLRNVIGQMKLNDILAARKKINEDISKEIDHATDPWGIKITRVEVKNINPPEAIRQAMEKEMKAERDKREHELRAEGRKNAAIMEAEAIKEKIEKEAEAQANAIRMIQEANAEGIRFLKEAGADQNVLTLKSFETMAKVADGKATKIIIPSELQNLAGTLQALSEVASNKTPKTLDDVEYLSIEKKDSPKEAAQVISAEAEKTEVKTEVKAEGSTTTTAGESEEKERKIELM